MLAEYFRLGGPVMWLVLAAWVVVLATSLDRASYWLGTVYRRPIGRLLEVARLQGRDAALLELELELHRAEHGLGRLDAASQIATSIGLFGTVLGIAQAFFSRGDEAGAVDPQVLASSLSTALFTTIAGLAVFLIGQVFLALFQELAAGLDHRGQRALASVTELRQEVAG
ncbi:MAG: MotA/TolQ/ExbB proton channel family protein [Planctomycetota bacterium]|nr:MAG: MotA/TolQ/ExbB proton channel family protein [Planctomycetota bacterium]